MRIAVCCVAVLCVALTACQSAPVAKSESQYDLKKMALVEGAARASGVQVHWVNPPLAGRAE